MQIRHNEIKMNAIGFVESPVVEQTDHKWGGVRSQVKLFEPYFGGLQGLEGFSHALVVTWLDQAKFIAEKHLIRRPQGRDDMPMVGIFSQRAKDRPNPVGITAVKIVVVGNDFIEVTGLDAINGTPVIDIKPYYPQYDLRSSCCVPEWVNRLMINYF